MMRRGWLLASGITLTMFVPMSPALAWVGGEPPDTAPVETTGLAVPMPIAPTVSAQSSGGSVTVAPPGAGAPSPVYQAQLAPTGNTGTASGTQSVKRPSSPHSLLTVISPSQVAPVPPQVPSRNGTSAPVKPMSLLASAPPAPPQPVWTLEPGTFEGKDIVSWGQSVGWKVEWNLPGGLDWMYPGLVPASYRGDFTDAAKEMISELATQAASQGVVVRYHFYPPNQMLVINNEGQNDAP